MTNVGRKVTLPRITFKNGKTIKHGDIVIPIPDHYHYTTDSSEMYEGKSYPILIVPDDYSFSDNPDDAPFSIAFEPYMTMSKDGKGIDIGPETAVGMERFLCMQWGQVFDSEVTWFDAGVRNGFGAFYQLFRGENAPSHRCILGMIVTRYQMGAVHIHCNQKNADLWNDPYGFIDKCNSFLEKVLVSGETAPSYVSTTPFETLYPHYSQLKGKSGPIAPGVTMITNATGTEYEFIPLSRAIDNDELPEDERAAYRRVIEKDTGAYDLADRVPEMQRLFHVNASVFNQKRDRECEIDQGLLHRAYMMSALRSFAWTLAEYCESKSTKPDNVPASKLKEIVAFCAKKEWLNYRGNSYCSGLCGCSDLHVFYIPDAVSDADRKKLLPSDELIQETERRKAALPYYNPILDEVHSLDALRKDLAYIYPAIHTLCDSLAQSRNYNEALTGNEADIVYAWCSLAKVAKEPFYVEDGPMHCYFTQIENEEETAARQEALRAQWEAEREENAERNKEEWLNNYGHAVEKNPDIQFDGKLFVFSGVDSDETIDAVMKRGGQQRSKISGITNYLIVDPRYCGESKTNNAIEQQKKGKPVKIILLDDLKAALEGKTEPKTAKAKPSVVETGKKVSTSASSSKTGSVSSPKQKSAKTTTTAAETKPATSAKKKVSGNTSPKTQVNHFNINSDGKLLSYIGDEKDIIVPDNVKTLNTFVFAYKKTIKTITLPNTIECIPECAFTSCEKLETVKLSDKTRIIEERAFVFCPSLKTITFPDTIRTIGDSAFYDDSALESIVIPEGCKSIGENCFSACSSLRDIYIPSSVTVIGKNAFEMFGEGEVTIHTPAGSFAESYAKKNKIKVDNKPAPRPASDEKTRAMERGLSDVRTAMDEVRTQIKEKEGEALSSDQREALNQMKKTAEDIEGQLNEGQAALDQYARFQEQKEAREKAEEEEKARKRAEAIAAGKSENDAVNMYVILLNEKELGKLNRPRDEFGELYEEDFAAYTKSEIIKLRNDILVKMNDETAVGVYAESFKKRTVKDRFTVSTGNLFNASDEQDFGKLASWAIDHTKQWYDPSESAEVKRLMDARLAEIRGDLDNQFNSIDPKWTKFSTGKEFLQIVITNKKADGSDIQHKYENFQIVIGGQLVAAQIASKGFMRMSTTVMSCFPWYWKVSVRDIWETAYSNDLRDERDGATNGRQLANQAINQIRAKYPRTGEQKQAPAQATDTANKVAYATVQPAGKKKEGCYIATAVYGSYDAPQVLVLRRFRDEKLQNTSLGRWFIRVYYKWSPSIAEKLKNAKRINGIVRSFLDKRVNRLSKKFSRE